MTDWPGPRRLTIATAVEPGEGGVQLSVADTGPGVPPRIRSSIFDPFFTTKPPGEGSGLGLSVSYGIVAEHKGRLRGENRTDRRGAIFTVELPAGEVA